MPAVDRKLSLTMTFVGYWFAGDAHRPAGLYGNASYAMTSSDPAMPGAVSPDGSIIVPSGATHGRYTSNCDLTFALAPFPQSYCTLQNGSKVPVTWAPQISTDLSNTAMIVGTRVVQGNGYTVVPNPKMYVSFVDSAKTQILVDDDDPGSNVYYYRPAIVVPQANNYYISCDPQITVKPNTN